MPDNFTFTEGNGRTGRADDVSGVLYPVVKTAYGSDGLAADADSGAGAAGLGTQRIIHASDDPLVALLTTLNGKDFATQTTLASILAKIIAAPATEATLAAILAKIIAAPATETTLASVLAALSTLPAGTNLIGATKDGGPNWTTSWGISNAPFTSADQSGGVASITDAPSSGLKIVLDDLMVSVDSDMSFTIKCETTDAIIMGPIFVLASVPFVWTSRGRGRKVITADKKLQIITSAAGNITVEAGYHSEA